MLCPIKVNSTTIELTLHTSCYCVLDLLRVNKRKCQMKYEYDQVIVEMFVQHFLMFVLMI